MTVNTLKAPIRVKVDACSSVLQILADGRTQNRSHACKKLDDTHANESLSTVAMLKPSKNAVGYLVLLVSHLRSQMTRREDPCKGGSN